MTDQEKIALLMLRMQTIENFLSENFEGFHADIVDYIANKLEGDSRRATIIAELEKIRAGYAKRRVRK